MGGFDEHMRWGEDWEIWLRFARNWEVGYLDAPSSLDPASIRNSATVIACQNRLRRHHAATEARPRFAIIPKCSP